MRLIFCLLVALLGQAWAFWPFSSSVVEALPNIAEEPRSDVRQVAIIGAGPGGASAAFHLRKLADEQGLPINITIFERNSYIGGRSTTVNAWNDPELPIELGASIFVKVNEILVNSTREFGLATGGPGDDDGERLLGIWSGEKFVFTQASSSWAWWDLAKLLWKYGMSAIRTNNLMKATVAKFMKLYQPPYFPFRSLSERVQELDLVGSTGVTGAQLLEQNNIYAPFTTDIIQASTRVNYGQNLGVIHGLETMVCMAIDGAMQVTGGNWQIFDRMVGHSTAYVNLETAVTTIEKGEKQYPYRLTSKHVDEVNATSHNFDSIVLAGPLQFSKIQIANDILGKVPDEIPYVRLHVTLFATHHLLSGKYFGLKGGAQVPDTVLTTVPHTEEGNRSEIPFFSISTLRHDIDRGDGRPPQHIYKIFSPEALTSDLLSQLFNVQIDSLPSDLDVLAEKPTADFSWWYPKIWDSYPYEYPRLTFEETVLAKGFYYTSGMESFISTMETSALMGKNVAHLVIEDFMAEGEHPLSEDEKVAVAIEEL